MTHVEELAHHLFGEIDAGHPVHSTLALIERALASAQAEAWEEAAQIVRTMPAFGGEQRRLVLTILQSINAKLDALRKAQP